MTVYLQMRTSAVKTHVLSCVFLCLVFFPYFISAKDAWTTVHSKNFELVGNAGEPEIRRAAVKLEQFRAAFRQIFPKLKYDSAIPFRIIVFKTAESYQPFQPVRDDGTIEATVVGSFHPGADVNYITLLLGKDENETFRTIYHEYTHFLINNNAGSANIPAWLHEGFAEYYQMFRLETNDKVLFGSVQPNLLALLQKQPLIPLETLFSTDKYALRQQADHDKSLFYAESWALIHYLQHGNRGSRREQLSKFFNLLLANKPQSNAFKEAFQTDYAALEKELRAYVTGRTFSVTVSTLEEKITAENVMSDAPISEAAAAAYLGDLLLHRNLLDAAAVLLEKALTLDDNSVLANAALGMTLVRQNKFDAAEKHLEKAIRLGSDNYLLHYYYAYALSREDADSNGYIKHYAPEKVLKIRKLLEKTSLLKPDFAESYNLLALIYLVNDENLDETVELFQKASRLEPGNQWYALGIAQVHLRQTEYEEAKKIAEKIFNSTTDLDLRKNSQAVVVSILQIQDALKRSNNIKEQPDEPTVTHPEIPLEEAMMQDLNDALRKPQKGERRLLGYLARIDCGEKNNTIVVHPANSALDETFRFNAAELQKVRMVAFAPGIEGQQMGCGIKKAEIPVVVTYRPATKNGGEIVSVEFVPKNFRFMP